MYTFITSTLHHVLDDTCYTRYIPPVSIYVKIVPHSSPCVKIHITQTSLIPLICEPSHKNSLHNCQQIIFASILSKEHDARGHGHGGHGDSKGHCSVFGEGRERKMKKRKIRQTQKQTRGPTKKMKDVKLTRSGHPAPPPPEA